jgi:7-cyano-7-deazaguanine synthase
VKSKAVVLLSGGIDSATALFMAKRGGYLCYPLTFSYGQRHSKEVALAKKLAKAAGCRTTILDIRLPWKGSALIDKKRAVPKRRSREKRAHDIPATYVPARNTIFLSYALSYAEAIGASKIFIGANAVDFSGYPDCRKSFIEAFDGLIREGTRAGRDGGISVEAPLLSMTKARIISEASRMGVPLEITWSCYEGKKAPCGACDSCIIRKKGFEEAGLEDPVVIRDDKRR